MNERDRLIELIEQHCLARLDALECTSEKDIECSECLADHLIANGVIVPPCEVGDYIEWDHGVCKKLHEVKGFNYCPGDLGLRFEIGICSPVVNRSAITRILTREEAEQALKRGVRTMSEWISVEERLPEDDCYVLCVSVSAEEVKRIGIRFFTRNALKPNGDFLLNRELSVIVVGDKITHWMPLPEPPEEGADFA